MISVAVTGSRELGFRTREDVVGAFDTFLLPFARLGARWVLGGAAGIDTMALDWLTGLNHPGSEMVVVPVTVADQPTASSASYRELGAGYGFTREKSLWYFGQYLPDGSDRRDPRISPLLEQDLTGLPPTLMVTAEYDPLRDDGEHYARAIRDVGGPPTGAATTG